MGLKERKQLAKRVIRSAQKLLNDAIDEDANYSAKSVQPARDELARLIEGNFQSRPHSTVLFLGGIGSIADVDMPDVIQNGLDQDREAQVSSLDSNHISKTTDVVMMGGLQLNDENIPDDRSVGDVIIAVESSKDIAAKRDSVTSAALTEVNGNISPAKSNQANSFKDSNTPPETHEDPPGPEVEQSQPGPPTPPVSNGDTNNEQTGSILTDGGVPPFLLEDFNIEGTQISEKESSKRRAEDDLSDILSDMDDDQVNELQPITDATGIGTSATGSRATPRSKKAKAKKRKR
jgi:NuA3 HAT complex component NTO1